MKNKKNILLIVSTVLSLGINGIFLFSNHALAEEALYATQDRSIGNKDVLIDGNKHYVLWNFSDKRGFGHSNIIPRDYYNSQIDKNIYPKLITTNAITSKGWEWKGKTGGYDFGFEATLNGGTKYVAFLDNVGFKSAKTVNVEIYIIGKKIASAPIKNGINGGHNITEFTTPGSVTESVDVEFRVVTFTDNSGGTYLQTKGDWGFASKNAREAASKYINNDLRYLSKENKIRFLSDLKYFKTDEEIQKRLRKRVSSIQRM